MGEVIVRSQTELASHLPNPNAPRLPLIDTLMEGFTLLQKQQQALTDPSIRADYRFMEEIFGTFKRDEGTGASHHAVNMARTGERLTTPAGDFYIPASAVDRIPVWVSPLYAVYDRAIINTSQGSSTDAEKAATVAELGKAKKIFEAFSTPFDADIVGKRQLGRMLDRVAYAIGEHAGFPHSSETEAAEINRREAFARMGGNEAKVLILPLT